VAWLQTIHVIQNNKAEAVKLESEVTGFSQAVQSKEYDLTSRMFSHDCKFAAQSIANLKRSFTDPKISIGCCACDVGRARAMILNVILLQPLMALIAGILILIVPRLLTYIVAIYLIIIGVSGPWPHVLR